MLLYSHLALPKRGPSFPLSVAYTVTHGSSLLPLASLCGTDLKIVTSFGRYEKQLERDFVIPCEGGRERPHCRFTRLLQIPSHFQQFKKIQRNLDIELLNRNNKDLELLFQCVH